MTQTGTSTSLRPISEIRLNPKNPRLIKDDKFKKLVKSLKQLPVMTSLREVIVDENDIIIGGNMRFRAAKEAGWKEIPVKKFTREMAEDNNELTGRKDSYEEYVKEIIVKDNVSGGEWDWDMLSSDWGVEELEDWGLEPPFDNEDIDFSGVKGNQDRETGKQTREFICPNCSEKFEV